MFICIHSTSYFVLSSSSRYTTDAALSNDISAQQSRVVGVVRWLGDTCAVPQELSGVCRALGPSIDETLPDLDVVEVHVVRASANVVTKTERFGRPVAICQFYPQADSLNAGGDDKMVVDVQLDDTTIDKDGDVKLLPLELVIVLDTPETKLADLGVLDDVV